MDDDPHGSVDRTGVRDDVVDRFDSSVGSVTDAKTVAVAVCAHPQRPRHGGVLAFSRAGLAGWLLRPRGAGT
jgi:hypothetical protein